MSAGPVALIFAEFFRPGRPAPAEEDGTERQARAIPPQDLSWIPPPAPKRSSRRFLAGLLISCVGIVLLLGALFAPWYSYTISGKTFVGNVYCNVFDRTEYSFKEVTTVEEKTAAGFTLSGSSTRGWDDYSAHYASSHGGPAELPGVYAGALVTLIAAFTLGSLGVFLAYLFRARKRSPLFPALVLLLGAFLGLAAAGAFASAHPGAVSHDRSELHKPTYPTAPPDGPGSSFSASAENPPLDYRWGPGSGWYLSLAGPILVMTGATLLYLLNRRTRE